MDIGRSFTYMFDDEKWLSKILIGGIVNLVPILNFASFGYMLETTKNTAEGRAIPLPEWGEDFGGKFVKGLLGLVIGLIYSIPIWLLWCLMVAITGGVSALLGGQGSEVAGTALTLASFCIWCLFALYGIFLIIWLPAALTTFAVRGGFGSAFQFGEIWRFIRGNLGNYLLAIVIYIVAAIIAWFGVIACFVGVLFTMFWAYLVLAFLMGSVWREAQLKAT